MITCYVYRHNDFIGNMGYPVITRLGVSQFWYKHWYNDCDFKTNVKQQQIFIKLFKLYINYGLSFETNIFFNQYFFNKNCKKTNNTYLLSQLKYFRRFFYSNFTLGIEHSYFLRYKTGEYFPLRIWFIQYSKWIIINFSCFKPIKKKPRKKSTIVKEIASINTSGLDLQNITKKKRFKLVYIALRKTLKSQYSYCF